MTYEPYLIEVDPSDAEFEESPLTKVEPSKAGDCWSITREDGWSLLVPRLEMPPHWTSPEPAVGDVIRVYGSFGRPVRGITLNGQVVFYRPPAMQEQHHRRFIEDLAARDERMLTARRPEMDADYDRLVPEFKERVDGFRVVDPEFRARSESYEVFCLLQAQAIADHFRDNGGVDALTAARGDGFGGFDDLWKWLTDAGVVSAQHSNNTFGAAVAFARHLLEAPAPVASVA